ncbi:MAG: hypothetical protein WCJ17_02885 [bacterium]
MKRYCIFLVLLISLVPSCYNATQCLADRNSLKEFVTLSQHCHASSQATSDKDSYDAFKRIKMFYLNHRNKFKKIDELDEKTATQLSVDCKKILQAALTKAVPATTRAATVKEIENMALAEALKHFQVKMPNLLKPTTTPLFLRRLLFLTLVEVAFSLAEDQITFHDDPAIRGNRYVTKARNANLGITLITQNGQPDIINQRPRPHKLPSLKTRFTSPPGIMTRGYFFKMMGLALGKTAAVALVNEYSPKGISSYIHTFLENMLPKFIAVALLFMVASTQKKPAQNGAAEKGRIDKAFVFRMCLKLVAPIILGKAFLHRSHALYKPLQIASYAFPFLAGATATRIMGGERGAFADLHQYANIFIDGAIGFTVFNAVPMGIEKALPKRNMKLNPAHRRKALKNFVRDMLDTCVKQWNKTAFSV